MIGPAGPTWWRIPLELLDRLPLIDIDSGVSDAEWNIVWQVRMPRVVLGGIVGAMLSLAGASYQGVFRNPLVDPVPARGGRRRRASGRRWRSP